MERKESVSEMDRVIGRDEEVVTNHRPWEGNGLDYSCVVERREECLDVDQPDMAYSSVSNVMQPFADGCFPTKTPATKFEFARRPDCVKDVRQELAVRPGSRRE
jgi:hypothetical protein